MNGILPVEALGAGEVAAPLAASATPVTTASSFGDMVLSGLSQVEQSSTTAMDKLAQYTVGGDVPAHELMISMEQARMAVQMTVEVRNRLLEAYQEVSRMQI